MAKKTSDARKLRRLRRDLLDADESERPLNKARLFDDFFWLLRRAKEYRAKLRKRKAKIESLKVDLESWTINNADLLEELTTANARVEEHERAQERAQELEQEAVYESPDVWIWAGAGDTSYTEYWQWDAGGREWDRHGDSYISAGEIFVPGDGPKPDPVTVDTVAWFCDKEFWR